MIAIEQRQKAPLRARRPLDAPEPEIVPSTLQVPQVPQELLDPQRCTLADGRQLRRLEVREAEGRQGAVLGRKCGEARDDRCELGEEEVEAFAQEDEVGVAGGGRSRQVSIIRVSDSLGNVARRSAEADGVNQPGSEFALVLTHWMMGAASGQTTPNVCTCAMTSSIPLH